MSSKMSLHVSYKITTLYLFEKFCDKKMYHIILKSIPLVGSNQATRVNDYEKKALLLTRKNLNSVNKLNLLTPQDL